MVPEYRINASITFNKREMGIITVQVEDQLVDQG
jgi:hypothetical protein